MSPTSDFKRTNKRFRLLFAFAVLALVVACGSSEDTPDPAPIGDPLCGTLCGECEEGTWECVSDENPVCVTKESRALSVDPEIGLPPAETGARDVFSPADYDGPIEIRLSQAGQDASLVGGAVVFEQVYETTTTVRLFDDVMYTGGGLRRACTPVGIIQSVLDNSCVVVDDASLLKEYQGVTVVRDPSFDGFLAQIQVDSSDGNTLCFDNSQNIVFEPGDQVIKTFNMAAPLPTYTSGIIVDSVLFDGNKACNDYTHDWRFNNTLLIRGDNIVRNSIFKNTPSENITGCRGVFENNVSLDLDGSFIHISCSADEAGIEEINQNYIARTNIVGDAAMGHSEGAITFSANSKGISLRDNIFLDGGEGVFGLAGPDDEDLTATNDCYANFPSIIGLYNGADTSAFTFHNVSFIGVDGQHPQKRPQHSPSWKKSRRTLLPTTRFFP